MTFVEFTTANILRCEKNFHPIDDWSETDWACALAGEVGELCNMIKKRRRGENIPLKELGKELADIMHYLDLLAVKLNLCLANEIKDKFNEVSDRIGSDIKL